MHATKARDKVLDLTGHLRDESLDQVNGMKGNLEELVRSTQNYALERPLACLGIAFIGGFLTAFLLRRSRN